MRSLLRYTACFQPVPQAAVRAGNGRPRYGAPAGIRNRDGALVKNFYFTQRVYLKLRGDFLNATNHPDPSGFGSTNITSSSFGQVSSCRAPRRIQIGAKFIF